MWTLQYHLALKRYALCIISCLESAKHQINVVCKISHVHLICLLWSSPQKKTKKQQQNIWPLHVLKFTTGTDSKSCNFYFKKPNFDIVKVLHPFHYKIIISWLISISIHQKVRDSIFGLVNSKVIPIFPFWDFTLLFKFRLTYLQAVTISIGHCDWY